MNVYKYIGKDVQTDRQYLRVVHLNFYTYVSIISILMEIYVHTYKNLRAYLWRFTGYGTIQRESSFYMNIRLLRVSERNGNLK
jgi:hypothetical protein